MGTMARIVIDCDEEYHAYVVEAAAARGMKYRQWIVGLIDDAIKAGPTLEDSVPPRYRPYLRQVAAVLSSGDDLAVTALAHNIDAFVELVELKKPRTGKTR